MKNSTSSAAASPDVLSGARDFHALAEGFRYPDAAWKGRYEAACVGGEGLPAAGALDDLQAVYHSWFGHAPACPLEVAYHLSSNPFEQAKTMAQMQGFYRAFGVETSEGERPDHLSVALSFASYLLVKRWHADKEGNREAADVTSRALGDFMAEFLAPGVAAFGVKAREMGLGGFYKDLLMAAERAMARVLNAPVPPAASRWAPPTDQSMEGEMKCGALPQ